jgi:hypothetical protein
MNDIDLTDLIWDRVRGYVTELRVDSRWILRKSEDNKPYGSLRIVSHPDLQPGYLRAIFTYVVSIKLKTAEEKLKTIEDYQMEDTELEVYSVDSDIKTETKTYEAPFKELENMFDVKIFN